MRVISIGSDRKIFEDGSVARQRHVEYGVLFDELHLVIFTLRKHAHKKIQISKNTWVYPTHSFFRIFMPFQALSIAKQIAKRNRDQLVVSVQDPFESGRVGVWIKRLLHIPLHVQVHTDFLSPWFGKTSMLNRIRRNMAAYCITNADAIRVVSQRVKDSIIRRYNISSDIVSILPIFVDVGNIQNKEVSFDVHDHYPEFNRIGLMTSRLREEKDIPLALKAFKKASEGRNDVGLVIAGDGRLEDDLKNYAHELGISSKIIFVGWQNDLISYFKTADFFLLTSQFEGFGMALVEAAASGMPIISTDVGVARDIISDGENGFICRVGDELCVREHLKQLIENDEMRTHFKNRIQESVHRFIRTKEEYLQAYKASIDMALQ